MSRDLTLTIDDQPLQITTRALTVRGAIRSAGYQLNPLDQVSPSANSWLSKTTKITLNRAYLQRIWIDPEGTVIEVMSISKTPKEILNNAGIKATQNDLVRINGLVVPLDQPIDISRSGILQYSPAIPFEFELDGQTTRAWTTQSTIGQALWQENVFLHGGDELNVPFTQAVSPNDRVKMIKASPLIIEVDGKTITTAIIADTVGKALVSVGIPLQDLDYSKPAETEPLPADGIIQVIRVKEEILLQQQAVPFASEFVADPELGLDQTKVSQPGEYGIQASRVRVRYENGVEVSRQAENSVTLKDPVSRIESYGTKIDLQTIDTPDGPMTYYRALTVTATSYSPCNSGVSECLYGTAMGIPVKKGVVAVHLDWYRFLKGSKIYIPGYGIAIVADTGVYPYNHNWVDLGFTDAEFAVEGKFISSITVYFLAPFPSTEPWILP